MRFLRPLLACVTLAAVSVSLPEVSAATYQIDATGDNDFQLYVSKKGSSTATALSATSFVSIGNTISAAPAAVRQPDWYTPSRYTNVDLAAGDVVSVYVHNTPGDSSVVTNPSAIIARIRETTIGGALKVGGESYSTDEKWLCAWRHENAGGVTDYDPSRLTGNANDWAAASLNVATSTFTKIGTQTGSDKFEPAFKLKQLGETSIWSQNDDSAIRFGLGYTGSIQADTPYWIYGNNQIHSGTELAHHGWCRFTIPGTGGAPIGGGNGDPVFTGFQGQVYQFHGLPDEHFNLISSPQVQLNAHFVYLSSGKCDYNDTACYTHPGTYMDVLGFTIAETQVKLVAGTHEAGLRVWVNDVELERGARNFSLSEKTQASIKFHKHGKVQIRTELMDFEVSNSDMFMNVGVALMNQELLRVGSKKHTITDKALCKHNEGTYNHELVESKVSEKYPITTPLHGLIGQTWRNLKVCGREWMGTVQDYVVSSLFGTDYHYKYFQY